MKFFIGIRFKLALLISILLAFMALSSSVIVINLMDTSILENFLKRGISTGKNSAVSAGYSLLANDILALDNLASQLKDSAEDIQYVAVVDMKGTIKAHSALGEAGTTFNAKKGTVIRTYDDGSAVTQKSVGEKSVFEFKVPIVFAQKEIGNMYVAIDIYSLVTARHDAQNKITAVAIVVLGIGFLGTFFLSKFFTIPVERLSRSVSQLSSGEFDREIRIVSNDELGRLTEAFNEMARTIIKQRRNLEIDARELEDTYLSTVKLVAAAIDARCPRTLGHSTRVAKLSVLCGAKMGLSGENLKDLEIACLFHDVGKIRIPDHILQKDKILSAKEKKLLMKHVTYGAEILELAESLHKHIPAVLYHHEWYNGDGYPEGLQGSEIPLFAAIIAIADAYDAITSIRPYKMPRTKKDAVKELKKYRGRQFDPKITDIFISMQHSYMDNTQKLLSKYDADHEFIMKNQ